MKTESNVVKAEPIDDVPLLQVKEEQQDDARGQMELELTMSKELIKEEMKVQTVKEEAKEEAVNISKMLISLEGSCKFKHIPTCALLAASWRCLICQIGLKRA